MGSKSFKRCILEISKDTEVHMNIQEISRENEGGRRYNIEVRMLLQKGFQPIVYRSFLRDGGTGGAPPDFAE